MTRVNVNKRKRIVTVHKDKTTAILLAVFFGLFAWIYTYKFDKGKFWGNLIAAFLTFGFWAVIAWLWALIDMAVKDNDMYENYAEWKVK